MKKALLGLLPLAALAALAVAGSALLPQSASSNSPIGSKILAHKLAVELGKEQPRGKEMPVSSGIMYTLYDAAGILQQRAAQNPGAMRALGGGNHGISNPKTEGCQNVFHGHGMTNTRVNQDCSLRRQAEETIQINPTNEKNIIAGQNDSRIGFNHCGYDWSFDGGKRWGDQVPPFWQFVLLDGHTADACSDPTLALDSQGNAYSGGVFFDINSGANAVLAMKSNAPNGGSFYHSPDPTGGLPGVPRHARRRDRERRRQRVRERQGADDRGLESVEPEERQRLHDVDAVQRPEPQPDLLQPVDGRRGDLVRSDRDQRLRTRTSARLAAVPATTTRAPIRSSGPDGTIYVSFSNGNVPGNGIEQVLNVTCPASADCSNQASWTGPTKVGDMISTQPVGPPSQNGCPNRQCLPPNGYRAPDETTVTNSVDRNGNDLRDVGGSPQQHEPELRARRSRRRLGAVRPRRLLRVLHRRWSHVERHESDVTPRSSFGETAQWQPWSEVTKDGSRLWVAFYDRHYGNCETTGCNDITAAQIKNPTSNHPNFSYTQGDDELDAEPDAGEQPGAGRLPGRLHVGRPPTIMVTRTSSGRTRARSGAMLRKRTSTTPRSTEAAEVTRHA